MDEQTYLSRSEDMGSLKAQMQNVLDVQKETRDDIKKLALQFSQFQIRHSEQVKDFDLLKQSFEQIKKDRIYYVAIGLALATISGAIAPDKIETILKLMH